jgi:hypothetical protein
MTGADLAMGTTRISTARFIYDGTVSRWLYLGQS